MAAACTGGRTTGCIGMVNATSSLKVHRLQVIVGSGQPAPPSRARLAAPTTRTKALEPITGPWPIRCLPPSPPRRRLRPRRPVGGGGGCASATGPASEPAAASIQRCCCCFRAPTPHDRALTLRATAAAPPLKGALSATRNAWPCRCWVPELRQHPGSSVQVRPLRRRPSQYCSASSCGHAMTSATPVSCASCTHAHTRARQAQAHDPVRFRSLHTDGQSTDRRRGHLFTREACGTQRWVPCCRRSGSLGSVGGCHGRLAHEAHRAAAHHLRPAVILMDGLKAIQ